MGGPESGGVRAMGGDRKSNEITAIPKLLKRLALEDCIVTVDALNCQRPVAATVIERGGDYAMAVKENQAHLFQTLEQLFTPEELHCLRGL